MPLEDCEAQLIVFSPGTPTLAVEKTNLDEIVTAEQRGETITVRGYGSTGGHKTAQVRRGDKLLQLAGDVPSPTPPIVLDGLWDFELKPTMDNRFGDFRLPATNTLLGAEARRFRYADETITNPGWQTAAFNDSAWPTVTCSFGPYFWKLGPLPQSVDVATLELQLAGQTQVDPRIPVEISGKKHSWQPYDFSMRWGVEGDPGHQGYHGLKEEISDDFIAIGRRQPSPPYMPIRCTYEKEPEGAYYLWTAAVSLRDAEARVVAGGLKPSRVWLNGASVGDLSSGVRLKAGANPLLLRYDNVGRGHFVLKLAKNEPIKDSSKLPLSMSWLNDPAVVSYDVRPQVATSRGLVSVHLAAGTSSHDNCHTRNGSGVDQWAAFARRARAETPRRLLAVYGNDATTPT